MTSSNPGALRVRARTQQVVDHHYDDAKPGKPLYLLIPGGLIALASLALIIIIAYRSFFDESMDSSTGMSLMLLLAPFYIGGVFLFSYGYELYDVPKALRDTIIIVVITLAAVVIIAVLFVVAGAMSGGKSSSSSKSSSDKSSSSGSSSRGSSVSTSSSSSGGDFLSGIGPIFVGGGGQTHTVTREVVREVPVAPPTPQPIKCPNCGRSYIPAETKFACPSCGAPTPPDLMQVSSDGTPSEAAPS